jgi:rRNA-processing protein FCF1
MTEAETPRPARAYLEVTRTSDGRYCVVFIRGEFHRTNFTPSVEQVVVQARRAGSIAVRTNDLALRQRCHEAGVELIEHGVEE